MLANHWKMISHMINRPWRWLAVLIGLAGGLALTPAWAEATWTAAVKSDPVTRQSRCLLFSEIQTTSDGYDSTPVTLVFDGVNLRVVTESELDPSFTDLRLEVDIESSIHGDQIVDKKMVLVFDQDIPKLIEQFRAGKQVTVHLRFWPTWPATQSFAIPFSLVGFSKAHDRFMHGCQPTG